MCQCGPSNQDPDALFQLLETRQTGIDFQNTITPNDTINLLDFEYLYNGGGVGVGDFDNDGFPDLVFTGNMVESRIYLNKGTQAGPEFEDITEKSGFDTSGKWCTGVSIVDINGDGLDDIYVCVGGPGKKSVFPNLLFINQGDLTFKESAAAYGLNDPSESNQAVFFDYDLDGDLDMYLLNGGGFEKSPLTIRPILTNGSSRNTDKLYQNNFNPTLGRPVFSDVSAQAGIAVEGFGLGAGIIDANQDGWPDVYVCNDYLSKDLLYINNQDGTFREAAAEYFGHTSHFSMGNDVGDINNDGILDLVTLDMLPESRRRRMTMFGPHLRDKYEQALRYGYGHQYMRNMLHLGSKGTAYSEVGQLAGIDRTDWSWCPLLADFDHDGLQDLFVTNGYGKDITDLDFVKFRQDAIGQFANPEQVRKTLIKSLDEVPPIILPNYIFKNNGNISFENKTKQWGFTQPSISNGAAYADLDLDGDLEIITNNIDQKAFIYKNTLRERDSTTTHFLKIKLMGGKGNPSGHGAAVSIYAGGEKQLRYKQSARGFQSSVADLLHFGLGAKTSIDSVEVVWPDGKRDVVQSVKADQTISLNYSDARPAIFTKKQTAGLLQRHDHITYEHKEAVVADDFKNQPLLLQSFNSQGPGMAVGDVNADGLDDLFIGGSYGSPAGLFLQKANGTFAEKQIPTENNEDLGALLLDIDKDGDLDLYVAAGGAERYADHKDYQDRVYLNDGKGNFTLNPTALPAMLTSTATVAAGDYDQDGDLDLFVGGRVIPGKYPMAPRSYLLQNNGGKFTDVTDAVCPALKSIGMVTSAIWTDFNNDKRLDLIVVGEMMKISVFQNDGKGLKNITDQAGLERSTGFWNSIAAGDFDNDGDMDYVLGNIGQNTPFRLSPEHPLQLHFADFDKNGSVDPIFSMYEEGAYYPFASLDVLAQQMPVLKKKFLKYSAYAKAATGDILQTLDASQQQTLTCEQQSSSLLENLGKGRFSLKPLPRIAQIAPVKGILVEDLNLDGLLDILLVGNEYNTEVVSGRYDASRGCVLLNEGGLSFRAVGGENSGFSVAGNARAIVKLALGKGRMLVLVGKNNGSLENYAIGNDARAKFLTFQPGEASATIDYGEKSICKIEYQIGSGYLSQQSASFRISPKAKNIIFLDTAGRQTRRVSLLEH
jgi:hypothetical protein